MGKNKPKAKISTRPNTPQSLNQYNMWYRYYYELCQQVAAATFRWQGLPREIDPRFLTMTLLNRGLAVFFRDDEFDKFFALMGNPAGSLNVYNNPTRFMAYGAGGVYHKLLGADECVPMWLNYYRTGMGAVFDLFAQRLAHFEKCEEVNICQQMTPPIIECDERIRYTVNDVIAQWQGGEPVIIGNDGLTSQMPVHYVFNDAPFILDKLGDSKRTCWKQFLTFIGVDNSEVDKPERVQSAEVNANNVEIGTMRLIRLDTLRQACSEINERYGLSVWVDFNTDFSSANWEYVNMLEDEDER